MKKQKVKLHSASLAALQLLAVVVIADIQRCLGEEDGVKVH